jgi:hypothetical protein
MCESLCVCMKEITALLRILANNYRPVRTFNTAVVYYHRFRLCHSDSEYGYIVSTFDVLQETMLTNLGCCCCCSFHGLQDRRYIETIQRDSVRSV